MSLQTLWLVLGDQLDEAYLAEFNPATDAVWMAEVAEESTHVWSHKARIALFLSAMRHFAERLRARGFRVIYHPLDAYPTFTVALEATLAAEQPERLRVVQPGEWRVQQALIATAQAAGLPLHIAEDTHFISTLAQFKRHAAGRKQLRQEYFYRELRQQTGLLMEGKHPVGGSWNFDQDNRQSFKTAPTPPPRQRFAPDATTQAVLELVNQRFSHHPGRLDHFDWPVTTEQAEQALDDFITHRLPHFGPHQDAMWTEQPFLYHATLSSSLNLKLINPRTVLAAAEKAYRQGQAPLASVEGFIRQILGWREYVRGIYWHFMPDYLSLNALNAQADLPAFYWTGDTEMACLRASIGQTLDHGYAHHIQRLMVTGLFALLLGVQPQQVHAWYLAVYVDAVEWVELPNTLGMSQFGDGGLMASKPYAATGKYIQRMSNYCAGCRYDPGQSTGPDACPFTTLYWDFLLRHEAQLAQNPRMGLQVKNLARLKDPAAIIEQAEAFKQSLSRSTAPK
jgi:deoxyribodipyrimidine photolyase-related protein